MAMPFQSSVLGRLKKLPCCQRRAASLFGAAVATALASGVSAGSACAASVTIAGIAADLTLGDKIMATIRRGGIGLGVGCTLAEGGGCTVTKAMHWAGGATSLFVPGVSTLHRQAGAMHRTTHASP